MRFIDTKIHGYLDYIMGLFLIVSPWILGFAEGGADQWVPVILGAGVIMYSFVTDYELGMLKLIPMTGHLSLDLMGGIFLAISPWLFGFAEDVFWPHLILGLLEIGASLFTKKHPPTAETSMKHNYEKNRV